MVNGIRTSSPCELNQGRGSKFCEGSRIGQETSKEGRRTYRPKSCEYISKDDDNIPKTLKDKNKNICLHRYVYMCTYIRVHKCI